MKRFLIDLLLIAVVFAAGAANAFAQPQTLYGPHGQYRAQYNHSISKYPPSYTVLSPSPGAYPYISELYYPSSFRYYPNVQYSIHKSYPLPPKVTPQGSRPVHLRPSWHFYP
jgi:hypothetical protein